MKTPFIPFEVRKKMFEEMYGLLSGELCVYYNCDNEVEDSHLGDEDCDVCDWVRAQTWKSYDLAQLKAIADDAVKDYEIAKWLHERGIKHDN